MNLFGVVIFNHLSHESKETLLKLGRKTAKELGGHVAIVMRADDVLFLVLILERKKVGRAIGAGYAKQLGSLMDFCDDPFRFIAQLSFGGST